MLNDTINQVIIQFSQLVKPILAFVIPALVFSVLELFQNLQCNPGTKWAINTELMTDLAYLLLNSIIRPYLLLGVTIALWTILLTVYTEDHLKDYLLNEHGPFGQQPFHHKLLAYIILSDFLLYWLHRAFHHPWLWRYHSIHHAEEQVEWTTAYRFHPINVAFAPVLTDVIMLHLGITPEVLIFIKPLDAAYSFFVHANLNLTLGPLRKVVASPVFHRWHHTINTESMSKNFAATFTIWDILFGTFFMPKDKLPSLYGVLESDYPKSFIGQLLYPFRSKRMKVFNPD